MSIFLDIISLVGSAASISGISLRDFRRTRPPSNQDKIELSKYVQFLEGRNVLLAPMDAEIQAAVIRSIEEIKSETEGLRLRCTDDNVKIMLLRLLLTMSEELGKMHGIDSQTNKGKYALHLSIQRIRIEVARALAIFCSAFDIDPSNSRLKEFILDCAVRPRN